MLTNTFQHQGPSGLSGTQGDPISQHPHNPAPPALPSAHACSSGQKVPFSHTTEGHKVRNGDVSVPPRPEEGVTTGEFKNISRLWDFSSQGCMLTTQASTTADSPIPQGPQCVWGERGAHSSPGYHFGSPRESHQHGSGHVSECPQSRRPSAMSGLGHSPGGNRRRLSAGGGA